MLSPLPPERSGVADHTALLLSPLAERVDLEVFTRDPERSTRAIRPGLPLRRYHEHRPDPDRVAVYQLGNHAAHHAEIYAQARAHPGIVVLHEYVLHDLVRDCAVAAGGNRAYHEELRYALGRSGERLAAALGTGGERPSPFAWPLFERAVDASRAVIVHSRAARDRIVKSRPLARVRVAPLALPPPADWSAGAAALRQELEVPPSAAVIGAFGVAAAAKRLDVVLRAFTRLAREHADCMLLIAGPESKHFLRETAGLPSELEPRVRVLDRVSIDRLQAAMAATDVALNLRHPTGGETSSTCLRLLGLGRAVIVSDTGWFAEIPADCCARISIDALEEPELDAVLATLLARPDLRRALGENGARWARTTHSIEAAVDAYAAVIDEVADENRRAGGSTDRAGGAIALHPPLAPYSHDDVETELVAEVAAALGDLGVAETDDDVLATVAGRLAELGIGR